MFLAPNAACVPRSYYKSSPCLHHSLVVSNSSSFLPPSPFTFYSPPRIPPMRRLTAHEPKRCVCVCVWRKTEEEIRGALTTPEIAPPLDTFRRSASPVSDSPTLPRRWFQIFNFPQNSYVNNESFSTSNICEGTQREKNERMSVCASETMTKMRRREHKQARRGWRE